MKKATLLFLIFGAAVSLFGQANQPPVISDDPGNVVRRPGETFLWIAHFSDPDGDIVTVKEMSRPSAWMGVSIHDDQVVFTGHPRPQDVGKHQVVLEVVDERGASARVEVAIRVTLKKYVADFNNDRATDFVYRLGDAFYYQSLHQDPVFLFATTMPADAVPLVGHFDWDTRGDIAIWDPNSGEWDIHLSTEDWENPLKETFGLKSSDVPFLGDVNGDLVDELIIRRWVKVNDGRWYVKELGSPDYKVHSFGGLKEDIPMVGDFNGDMLADFAIKRRNTGGDWYFKNIGDDSHTGPISFGVQNSDRVCPADYDGDERTDPALRRLEGWRPGHWYARLSSTKANYLITFGQQETDIEVPGDYNADGKADRAIYRPTTGEFILQLGTEHEIMQVAPAWSDLVPVLAPSTAKKELLSRR